MSDALTIIKTDTREIGEVQVRSDRFADGVVLLTFSVGRQCSFVQLQLSPHEQRAISQLLLNQEPDAA